MESFRHAKVVEVLPDKGGVRVQFTDLVYSGAAQNDFVRVLQSRMSLRGGASCWLPEMGELGIVAQTAGGNLFWLGSIPFQDGSQIDPTPGISFTRHQSGLTLQSRENGDCELLHPSGMRITMSSETGPLPPLLRTTIPIVQGGPIPGLEVDHPSGFSLRLGTEGDFSITFPSGSGIDFNADGSIAITGAGDIDVSGMGTATFSGSPDVVISGADTVKVTTLGDCSIAAGGDVSIESAGGNVSIESAGGDVSIESVTGNVSLDAFGDVSLTTTTGNVSITTTLGTFTLLSTLPVNLTSVASITLTAPAISLMGSGTLNGSTILTA